MVESMIPEVLGRARGGHRGAPVLLNRARAAPLGIQAFEPVLVEAGHPGDPLVCQASTPTSTRPDGRAPSLSAEAQAEAPC